MTLSSAAKRLSRRAYSRIHLPHPPWASILLSLPSEQASAKYCHLPVPCNTCPFTHFFGQATEYLLCDHCLTCVGHFGGQKRLDLERGYLRACTARPSGVNSPAAADTLLIQSWRYIRSHRLASIFTNFTSATAKDSFRRRSSLIRQCIRGMYVCIMFEGQTNQ